MVDIVEFFDEMPKFTKSYIILSLVLGVSLFLGLLPLKWVLVLTPNELWNPKFLLSFAFLGKISMNLVFELYFFSMASSRLEQTYAPTRYGDFFYMLLFMGLVCILGETVVNYGDHIWLSKSFVMAITYVFCKRNPSERMRLMFMFDIKAAYLPFALLVLEVIQGGSFWSPLIGIAAGHLYVYLKDILPVSHRKDFLGTPMWMVSLVNRARNSQLPYIGQGGVAQAMGRDEHGNRPFMGRGVRIG